MTLSIGDAPNVGAILFSIFLFCLLASGNENAMRVKREDKLIVTTIQVTPYYMKSGDTYEGYIVDLMQKVKEKSNLTFQFSLVADGKFGSQEADGSWNGMVGEVDEGKASIAAAPLTVTDQRRSVLDFTIPFMSVNLSLILLKPHEGKVMIHNVKELTEQTFVKCGVIRSGSTFMFFNTTQDPLFQKLNQMILSDPKNLVSSYDEGIKKVRSSAGRFGMITESVTADYHSGLAPCDLVAINLINYDRSYALAVKKGSQVKATLDSALEQLKSGGHASELERLKQKWWKSECSYGSSVGVGFQSLLLMILMVSLGSLVGSV